MTRPKNTAVTTTVNAALAGGEPILVDAQIAQETAAEAAPGKTDRVRFHWDESYRWTVDLPHQDGRRRSPQRAASVQTGGWALAAILENLVASRREIWALA